MRVPLLPLVVLLATVGCTTKFDPALLDGCNGCSDGISCLPGNTPQVCGAKGATCTTCDAVHTACEDGACVVDNAVVDMSLSGAHTTAIDRNGQLWVWGRNISGNLAEPVTSAQEEDTPIRVNVAGVKTWKTVAAAGYPETLATCAISTAGALYCWGTCGDGQCGLTTPPGPTPTRVGSATWRAVGGGSAHTCGLQTDGSLWCWGWAAPDGRLGLAATVTDTKTPQHVDASGDGWKQLAVGLAHSCAIKTDGALYCWGSNDSGELGHTTVAGPAQVTPNGTSYLQVSAGKAHTCGIRTNHTLWCWGDNSRGQLGFPGSASTPQQIDQRTDWAMVSAAGNQTCAVRNDGGLFCWGAGDMGQLGTGKLVDEPTPTPVAGGAHWALVTAGGLHACGVQQDGTLWCWGDNGYGEIGATTFQPAPSPVNVLLK